MEKMLEMERSLGISEKSFLFYVAEELNRLVKMC